MGETLSREYQGKQAEELKEILTLLRNVLMEFRDDELEHLDTAVELSLIHI